MTQSLPQLNQLYELFCRCLYSSLRENTDEQSCCSLCFLLAAPASTLNCVCSRQHRRARFFSGRWLYLSALQLCTQAAPLPTGFFPLPSSLCLLQSWRFCREINHPLLPIVGVGSRIGSNDAIPVWVKSSSFISQQNRVYIAKQLQPLIG